MSSLHYGPRPAFPFVGPLPGAVTVAHRGRPLLWARAYLIPPHLLSWYVKYKTAVYTITILVKILPNQCVLIVWPDVQRTNVCLICHSDGVEVDKPETPQTTSDPRSYQVGLQGVEYPGDELGGALFFSGPFQNDLGS